MATRGVFLATLAAVAAPLGCLADEGQSPWGSQCAASDTGVHFQSSAESGYTGLQARVDFAEWGDGVFSHISKNESNGAVELVFGESARNKTVLQVGWSGAAALSFSGVRVLVQRTAYRANGLAGEAELRVEFNRLEDKRCFQDCSALETNAKGAVLIMMMYRDTDDADSLGWKDAGERLAAFLDGVKSSNLEQVHKAGFDPSTTGREDHMAAYFPTDPLGGCDDILHIVQLKPVPSARIPAEFCESIGFDRIRSSDVQIKQILLSTRKFPKVGRLSMQEMEYRRNVFFAVGALVNVGLLLVFFTLERRKRHLALTHDQRSTRQSVSVDSESVEEGDPEAPSSALLPKAALERLPSSALLQRAATLPSLPRAASRAALERLPTSTLLPRAALERPPAPTEDLDDGISSRPLHGTDGMEFFQGYSIQDFEDSHRAAVVEYWNLLDAQEQCHWSRGRRLVCLFLHFMYVVLVLSYPIRDKFGTPDWLSWLFHDQAATCYQGIPWEAVYLMVELYIVSKIFELGLLATSNKARGRIRWVMLPIEFMAGLASYCNSFTDITSVVVARACLQEAWWGSMMVVFTIGVVLFHWTLLIVLSLYWDRSNKCLYKILHMSVLAGSIKLHPEDSRAWYLWTVICWSQIIVQDLLMGSLQLWFWVRVEHNGTMVKALIWTIASFILSFHAAIDPTVTFGPEDLDQLRAIAKLQHYMEQSIEDYDKVQMRTILEEASKISLLQESQTLQKAARFRLEQEVQIQEGSAVGAYYPVTPTERSALPYPAKVERINYSAFTVRLKFDDEGISKDSVDVDRRYVVEDRDLTAALKGLGILKDSDPKSMQRAEEIPPWECQVMKSLHGCQRNALKRVRVSAENLHRDALVKLRKRCEGLGIKQGCLEQIFEWVLWDAPIIIHIDLDTVGRYLMEDSYYRNQFETGSTKGLNILPIREGWEEKLFGECYKDALPFERPKYGVLDIMNDPEGVAAAKEYGRSYAILKQARFRCTLTPRDSGHPDCLAEHVGTLDMCAHVLLEFSDEELREVHRVATAEDSHLRIGDSRQIEGFNYKELQLHGELDLKKHVKRLVVDPQHLVYGLCSDKDDEQKLDQEGIERLCKEHGWELSYIGDPDKAKAAGFSESKFKWEKDLRMEQRWRTCPTHEELLRQRSSPRHTEDEGVLTSIVQRITQVGTPAPFRTEGEEHTEDEGVLTTIVQRITQVGTPAPVRTEGEEQ